MTAQSRAGRPDCRGFMSREGIDHEVDECYAPVMSYDTFRLILSTAAGNGWAVQQVDIANAFLGNTNTSKDISPTRMGIPSHYI